METHKMKISDKYLDIIKEVSKIMDPFNVYITGGFVRDTLLNRQPKDIDFSTNATPDEIEEKIRASINKHGHNRKCVTVGKSFGCLKTKVYGEEIDIVTFREEEYATHSRKPNVTFGTDLVTDLSRRDFTINSLALDCQTMKFIDQFGGMKDLEDGIIRAVGSPKLRFNEDPLRILRAIRFATVLGFEIEETTLKKLNKMVHTLMRISKERWVEEFNKILKSDNVFDGLTMLWEYRVFNFTIPELAIQYKYDQNSRYHNLELWEHTANVVKSAQAAGEPIEMLWAALFHDIGKPATRTDKDVPEEKWEEYGRKHKSNYILHEKVGAEIALRLCAYLKFSNALKKEVYELIRNHLKDESPLRVYDNMHKSKLAKELDKK